jgi:hypothetical protein
MTPYEERVALAKAIEQTTRAVAVLSERAQCMECMEAYYALNGAWHKLNEAERALGCTSPRTKSAKR